MNGNGPLSFEAEIKDINFKAQLDAMERRIMGVSNAAARVEQNFQLEAMERRVVNFSNTAARETTKISLSFKELARLAVGAFAIGGLAQLPADLLKVRGEFQSLEIAFETMLKSKAKGQALLAEVTREAAATPLSLLDVASGAKQLLAYGSAADKVVGELHMLGDVAAGVGAPLNDLVYLYGTLRSQGRAYSIDVRQFASRGIPIYQALADVLKINVDQVNKFVEDGKVGFKEVEQAFKNMTSTGGLFAGLMDAQSKSLQGLRERLGSAWDSMLDDIGKKNEGLATQVFATATSVVEHYQQVADILGVVAAAYGGYKAAILLVSVAQQANLVFTQTMALQQGLAALAGNTLSASQLRLAATTSLLSRAQAALNSTMLANPYILVGTALAALVAYVVLFDEETNKLKTAQQFLAESTTQTSSSFNKQQGEIKSLIGVIQNQNVAESERLNAYEKLKTAAPDVLLGLDFQRAKTADLTKALNTYLVSLRQKIQLESLQSKGKEVYDQQADAAERLKKAEDAVIATRGKETGIVIGQGGINGPARAVSPAQQARMQLEQARKDKQEADKVAADFEKTFTQALTGASSRDQLLTNIKRQEELLASLTDKLSPAYKAAEDALKGYRKELTVLDSAQQKSQAVQSRGIEQIEEEIKAKRKLLVDTNSDAQNAAIRKEINKLEAQKRRLTGELSSAEKEAAKLAEKSGPFGSIDYYEQVAKKADEVLQKLAPNQTAEIAQQSKIKFDAEQKADELRKQYALKTFEEELADKQTKYVLYQKWVAAYGKQAADTQFGELIKSGQSYVDYLNTQISQLEAQKENVRLTDKQAGNLSSLLDRRAEATGKKAAIDVFREDLQRAGQQAANLTDYLEVLRQKQEQLNPSDNSELAIAKRLELAQQIAQAENDRRIQLQQYLQSVAGTEAEALAIAKKYQDLRAGLDKQYADKRTAGYQKALEVINQAEADEVKASQERTTQTSAAYKKLDEVIMSSGRKAQLKRLADLNDYLAKEKAAINTQAYQQKLKERNDLVVSIKDDDLARINEYAGLVSQLGSALTALGGDATDAGNILTGVASQIGLFTAAFEKDLSNAKKVQIGVQALVSIVDTLITASAKRKQADKAYYDSVIAQQAQYNLLLNEQIGLRTKNQENIFVKDYIGELKDGFDKFDDAQGKYQEALKKLAQGQAKIGVSSSVDFGAVAKSAVNGAIIGSIVPGIGTAIGAGIGAVVGGIVGLFAKKTDDEFTSLLQRYPQLIQKSKDGVDELNTSLAQTLISQNLVDDATKQLLQSTIDWQKQMEEAKAAVKAIAQELVGGLGDKLRDSLVDAFKEGTDSALAFKQVLGGIIEDFVTKLLYSKVLGPFFDKLEKDITASLAPGGDKNIIDDLQKFYADAGPAVNVLNQGLQALRDQAKGAGFDILQRTNTGSAPNSLSKTIQGVSETTANILAGQMNAIRITQADTNGVIRQQLLMLSNISANSDFLRNYLPYLDSINKSLKDLAADPLRGLGGGPK